MSFVKIMVHAVWGTKYRSALLADGLRQKVCNHIKENATSKNIRVDTINGHTDHLHCLAELNPDLTIRKQMQLIKGESSNWINKNNLMHSDFSWAEDYYAVSVSEDDLQNVRNYINNQHEHHRKKTFLEEVEELKKQFGLDKG